MTACFFGTSNFVLKDGVVKAFREASGATVLNRSIGGCTSAVGGYLLDPLPPSDSGRDLLFIDYQINDHQGVAKGIVTPAQLAWNFRNLIVSARRAGYVPVVLMLPSAAALRAPIQMEQMQEELCRELKVHHWNVGRDARAVLARGTAMLALMRDPAHMSATAAAVVGQVLAEVAALVATADRRDTATDIALRPCRRLEAADLVPADQVHERRSSLRTTRLARLSAGDSLHLPVGPDEVLAGVMMNTGAEGSVARFDNGRRSVAKRLVMYWNANAPDGYSLILADLFDQLEGSAGGIRLTLEPADHPVTEPMLHGRPPLPGRYGTLELDGFLILSREPVVETTTITEFAGLGLDLSELCTAPDAVTRLQQALA